MRFRLLMTILGATLALTLGVAGVACGDDDDDTNGDGATNAPDAAGYYSDVDRIQNSLTEQLDSISEQSDAAYGDPDKALTSLSAAESAGSAALEDLNALEAPPVATTAHADLVTASEDLVAAVQDLIDGLAGIEEGPEFEGFLADVLQPDSAYSQAAEEMREACSGMQAAADNSLVEIVFQCPV